MSKKATVSFRVRNRDAGNKTFMLQFHGRSFDLDGKQVDLFPIRVFAKAINRSTQSVQEWTKSGLLFPPMFKIPGSTMRMYTRWQILNAHYIYWSRYGQKSHYDRDAFLKDLKSIWYEVKLMEGAQEWLDTSQTPNVTTGTPRKSA